MLTQKRNPKEAANERTGQMTPAKASHGLLATGSLFRLVPIVKTKMTRKVTLMRGNAWIPKLCI